MRSREVGRTRILLAWTALVLAVGIPVIAAAASPLLAWRGPLHIVAGLAGVIALALLLVQPLLAGGYLPALAAPRSRRLHRTAGGFLVLAVAVHVAALWGTSPPDVVDALLFAAPTPFSLWGVIAMWAVFAAAAVALARRRLRHWRHLHAALAVVVVGGSVLHALPIVGTMETVSKVALCGLVVAATARALTGPRGRAG